MPNVNVRIATTGGIHKVTISPQRLRIPNGSTNVVITWRASNGTTFLTGTDAFQWINPSTVLPPPNVTRTNDTTLTSDAYTNNTSVEVIWEYMLGVEKDGVKIQVDPEVDNDPPRPIGDDERVGSGTVIES